MDWAGAEEDMEAPAAIVAERAMRGHDIALGRARERAEDRAFHLAGDDAHGLFVARRGGGETSFDDIDAHLVQQLGDAQFFFMRHRGAGRLLAVAQSGVENLDLLQFNVGHDLMSFCSPLGVSVSPLAVVP